MPKAMEATTISVPFCEMQVSGPKENKFGHVHHLKTASILYYKNNCSLKEVLIWLRK